jgi:tRNA 2-selenouridine synthase
MKAIEAKEFFKLSSKHPVIDVRTPAEFEGGHIPGALNIPLFSNEERAEVGTIYKLEGKKQAIVKGMELVSPKFTEFLVAAEKLSTDGRFLVHCWRGGMRSAGMAWLFELYGFKVFTLKGGYKLFRRMILDTFSHPYKLKILGGRTGSGKTMVLKEIGKLGANIIDLEAMAHHKGSAFGSLGEPQQPTQEMFENELAVELLNKDADAAIWLEDESQNVGKRLIPNALFAQMRTAKVYYVDLPIVKRVEYLTQEYGKYSKEELLASIDKIWKRLGPQHAKAAKEAIELGDLKRACEISLVYYDKSYDHGIAKRSSSSVTKKSFADLKPDIIAKDLIENL